VVDKISGKKCAVDVKAVATGFRLNDGGHLRGLVLHFAKCLNLRRKASLLAEEMPRQTAIMRPTPFYYEGELYNIIRNGRGVPAVPLVIVGVVP